MSNTHRSKPSHRELAKRKRDARKPTAASIAQRYLELQQLRQRLTAAQSLQGSA
jgi:hypothetical protein